MEKWGCSDLASDCVQQTDPAENSVVLTVPTLLSIVSSLILSPLLM